MSKRLENKVAIITGATSGIGYATAILFAKEGAEVVLAGRRENLGNELVDKIKSQGGKAVFVKTDATKLDDLKHLVKTAADLHGRIDILVNNAGVLTAFNFTEMDEVKDFDTTFNLNVKSYFLLCKEVLPYMVEQRSGSIVNTASIGGIIGIPHCPAYSASKGAIVMFTKSLAGEYAKAGIRVNAILPGLTNSEMVPVGSDFEKEAIVGVPIGRAAAPEEIAAGTLFLASDESSFCVGTCLVVDGGATSVDRVC
ncbi:MAG: glucose 1-dehydrogenase [Desulfuromonadales bacterium]|nr:glucose 1-dehydrogenase [Desulfuromonadales bacterium]NVN91446.1 glucose 1-dehydrogenase [Desulfuromonadales bacterium]